MPEYAGIHSHVLQDVLARLDKTYQAFFRRVKAGEKAGFPRYQGRDRYHSFTYKEFGNGATLDNGNLVLSKIGRIAVWWSRPLEGTPRWSRSTGEQPKLARPYVLRLSSLSFVICPSVWP